MTRSIVTEAGSLVPDLAMMVERFSREIVDLPIPSEPERLPAARKEWATRFLQEEVNEYAAADNIDDEADALLDLTYVALGRLVEMGIAPRPVFEEVHLANMRKKRGELAKRPGSAGHDAVKPTGWTPPDLEALLTVTLEDARRVLDARRMMEDSGTPAVETFDHRNFLVQADLPRLPRIILLGHARHGKDTVAEMLRDDFGYRFTSSSMFCAERVVYPASKAMHLGYASAEACFEDRGNQRSLWYDLITEYNAPDRTRLAREIFADYDLYVGMRNAREFHACRNAGDVFDVAIWVDRSEHVGPEGRDSCTVEPWMADYVLDNNGDIHDTRRALHDLMGTVLASAYTQRVTEEAA